MVVLDDLSGGVVANLDAFKEKAGDRLSFIDGSILDVATVELALADCTWVFHWATWGSVPRSVAHPSDFTFLDNAVHANLLAVRYEGRLKAEVFNVACGERVSVNQLAQIVGRPELPPTHEPERAGDVKHSLADLQLIQQTRGYQSLVSFEDDLKPTVQWFEGQQSFTGRSTS